MFKCGCCRYERDGSPIFNTICETSYCDECNAKLILKIKDGLIEDIFLLEILSGGKFSFRDDKKELRKILSRETVDKLIQIKKELQFINKRKKN